MVKFQNAATIFQPEANILKTENGREIKIGQIRCNEFNYFLYPKKILPDDVIVKEVEASERKLKLQC